jgi:membrane peptidoglycan carboxypeptidase
MALDVRRRLFARGRPGLLRFLVLLVVVLPVVALTALFATAFARAPSVTDLPLRVAAFEHARGVRPLPLSRIAPDLRDAVVATEDERFYSTSGVDLLSLLRAVPYDVSHLSLAQGASTITEQLAKIVYLGGSDHSASGKATEVALGFRIGHRYDHEQVLDDYLNVVYLGEGGYGVANASRHYFGRSAAHLDLAQASLLAGLIQSPALYDPVRHPYAARTRQVAVLRSMVRNGFVTEEEASRAVGAPLDLAAGGALPPLHAVGFAPPAPFDWAELAVAVLLLAGAAGALVTARLVAPRVPARVVLRLAAAAMLVAGAIAAARSVQVV